MFIILWIQWNPGMTGLYHGGVKTGELVHTSQSQDGVKTAWGMFSLKTSSSFSAYK